MLGLILFLFFYVKQFKFVMIPVIKSHVYGTKKMNVDHQSIWIPTIGDSGKPGQRCEEGGDTSRRPEETGEYEEATRRKRGDNQVKLD